MDSDFTDPSVWTFTPFLKYDPDKIAGALDGKNLHYPEGNLLLNREGKLVMILRYNTADSSVPYGKAVLLETDENGWLSGGKTIDFIGTQWFRSRPFAGSDQGNKQIS